MNCKETLLAKLDFSVEGLHAVGELAKEGRLDEAFLLVMEHFRSKRTPKYLFEASQAGKLKDDHILADAEAVMNHFIFGHQFEGDIDWTFNPTDETSHDNEWSWSLYRTIYWQSLARAYALNGDERYAEEFAKQLKSFYEAWPAQYYIEREEQKGKTPFPGHAWRTIEAGIRIYTTWLPCMEIFRSSPSFDEETWAIFLCSIHDHGTFLSSHYSNHEHSSNWLSMESSALLQLGIMFPEFKDAANWKALGYQRVMHEIVYCFDNDGAHMEHTPIYHLVASIAFLQAVQLCKLNGIAVAPYAMPLLEKSAEFVMSLVKPDFSTPMIGDADRVSLLSRTSDTSVYEGMNLSFFPEDTNELRAYFAWMSSLTERKDFLYLATGGKEGVAPRPLDFCMQESGLYVMRTGWENHDSYFHLQGISLERGEKSTHSHNDTGHLELMIGGDDILIDCGRYIYNSSSWTDWRHYFTHALAHNTLFVDDHMMGSIPGVPRVRGVRTFCHAFERREDLLLMDISHNGYVFTEDPIFHRRKVAFIPSLEVAVIIDHVTGLGIMDHDLRFIWNFASEQVTCVSPQVLHYSSERGTPFTMGYAITDGDAEQAFCTIDQHMMASSTSWKTNVYCGSEEPKAGWVSYGYPLRKPTGQVQVSKHGRVPVTLATVIARRDVSMAIEVVGNIVHVQLGEKTLTADMHHVEVR